LSPDVFKSCKAENFTTNLVYNILTKKWKWVYQKNTKNIQSGEV
jgi:hypothetical protein